MVAFVAPWAVTSVKHDAMQESAEFRYKFGTVRVDRERLTLEQSNRRGKLSNAMVGRSSRRVWFIYFALLGWMLWQGWQGARSGSAAPLVIPVLFGVYLFYQYKTRRDFTLVREMSREQVTRIETIRGVRFLTLNRMVVHLVVDGEPHRRYIMMPTTLQGGDPADLEVAVACLTDAGWPVV